MVVWQATMSHEGLVSQPRLRGQGIAKVMRGGERKSFDHIGHSVGNSLKNKSNFARV
jgi:hypothetical protein